jgi:hypothetical protein
MLFENTRSWRRRLREIKAVRLHHHHHHLHLHLPPPPPEALLAHIIQTQVQNSALRE